MRGILVVRGDVVALGELPVESSKSGLLHRVSNDGAVFEKDKRVGSSEGERSVLAGLGDRHKLLRVGRADESAQFLTDCRYCSLHTSDTFNNQIFTGDGTSFVETTDIDTSSERNSERLCAEDC